MNHNMQSQNARQTQMSTYNSELNDILVHHIL